MPAEFEVRDKLCPLEREMSSTEALVITAPLSSLTTPRTTPLATATCAVTIEQATVRSTKPLRKTERLMVGSPRREKRDRFFCKRLHRSRRLRTRPLVPLTKLTLYTKVMNPRLTTVPSWRDYRSSAWICARWARSYPAISICGSHPCYEGETCEY